MHVKSVDEGILNRELMEPNVFIIGAPKCGTSALSSYLASHPQVFFSPLKEPSFWCDDFPALRHEVGIDTLRAYSALFERAGPEHRAIGEGSTRYLCSEVAVERINAFNPSARFLVMLRNPVEAAYADHAELLFNFIEDVPDFESAWRLQSARREGKAIPRNCRCPRLLQYGEMASYSRQISRLFAHVPPDRRKVVIFDDFAANTRQVYLSVLDFLGLSDDGRRDFPRVREAQAHRQGLSALLRFYYCPPAILEKSVNWFKRRLRSQGSGLSTLRRLVRVRSPRPALDPGFVDELRAYFAADIEELSALLERDLTSWRRGQGTEALAQEVEGS